MKTIRVYFYNWIYPGGIDNIFLYTLKKYYNVELDSMNPDIVFFMEHLDIPNIYNNSIKILVTGEPGPWTKDLIKKYQPGNCARVSFENADYVISSYYTNDDNMFRLPIYQVYLYYHLYVTKYITMEKLITEKKYTKNDININFCVFMHSHHAKKRDEIFYKLSKYKKIDSLGPHLHNVPFYVPLESNWERKNKIDAIKGYKFCFGLENFWYKEDLLAQNIYPFREFFLPGLLSEKIIEPYIAGCVPLYYGNDRVGEEFNIKSMVNWHDFDDDDKFVEKIIELDTDDNKYLEYLNQPSYNFNAFEYHVDRLGNFLKKIIEK